MKRICVFCGARNGGRPAYHAAATALGRALAARDIELVFGGGRVGLMGAVADAALAAGGRVTGILPHALLAWEVGHGGLHALEVVDSMHARKARMAELADGFIALPGGLGTFEELFEILTWAQLGFHRHPVVLLDVEGYYQPLRQLIDGAIAEGFVHADDRALLLHADTPEAALAAMAAYRPAPVPAYLRETGQR